MKHDVNHIEKELMVAEVKGLLDFMNTIIDCTKSELMSYNVYNKTSLLIMELEATQKALKEKIIMKIEEMRPVEEGDEWM